jgi:hypothetical protein
MTMMDDEDNVDVEAVNSDPGCQASPLLSTRWWGRKAMELLLRRCVVEVALVGQHRERRRAARW